MAWVEKTGQRSWRVRYRNSQHRYESQSGFDNERAAARFAGDVETDRRRGQCIDPSRSATPVVVWAKAWIETLDVEPRTEENYRRYLRIQILPRWGSAPLGAISASAIAVWLMQLREVCAASTVKTIRTVFSIMLEDAVDDRLIPANPARTRRRRGRRRDRGTKRTEQVWATPEEVLRIAENATTLGGPTAGLLVVTAAWTGCRWGELAGLQRDHVDLDRGVITIDPDVRALHESSHRLWLGPPKTPSSARDIQLPPFLTVFA